MWKQKAAARKDKKEGKGEKKEKKEKKSKKDKKAKDEDEEGGEEGAGADLVDMSDPPAASNGGGGGGLLDDLAGPSDGDAKGAKVEKTKTGGKASEDLDSFFASPTATPAAGGGGKEGEAFPDGGKSKEKKSKKSKREEASEEEEEEEETKGGKKDKKSKKDKKRREVSDEDSDDSGGKKKKKDKAKKRDAHKEDKDKKKASRSGKEEGPMPKLIPRTLCGDKNIKATYHALASAESSNKVPPVVVTVTVDNIGVWMVDEAGRGAERARMLAFACVRASSEPQSIYACAHEGDALATQSTPRLSRAPFGGAERAGGIL